MVLLNGIYAGAMGMLAIVCTISYREKKDRQYLWMALIAAIFVPLSLLGNRYLLVTTPIVWGFVVVLALMVRKARKGRLWQ